MRKHNTRDMDFWLCEIVGLAKECRNIIAVRASQGILTPAPSDVHSDILKRLNELIQNLLVMDKETREDCDVK